MLDKDGGSGERCVLEEELLLLLLNNIGGVVSDDVRPLPLPPLVNAGNVALECLVCG